MRKRAGTITGGLTEGDPKQFGVFTITMLSQTVTHPLQCNIADYFSRTSGGDPCCRSCGELNKSKLVTFGENIYCSRCSNEMKNFYMESYNKKEEMREKALKSQREMEKPQSPITRNAVFLAPVSSAKTDDGHVQTLRTRARGFSSILASNPHSRLGTLPVNSTNATGSQLSSPIYSPSSLKQ